MGRLVSNYAQIQYGDGSVKKKMTTKLNDFRFLA